jgi:hypothetical protein
MDYLFFYKDPFIVKKTPKYCPKPSKIIKNSRNHLQNCPEKKSNSQNTTAR